jgi:hypothetical protein
VSPPPTLLRRRCRKARNRARAIAELLVTPPLGPYLLLVLRRMATGLSARIRKQDHGKSIQPPHAQFARTAVAPRKHFSDCRRSVLPRLAEAVCASPASTTSARSQPRSGDQKVPITAATETSQILSGERGRPPDRSVVHDGVRCRPSRSDKSGGYIESDGGTSCQSFPRLKMLGSETAQ